MHKHLKLALIVLLLGAGLLGCEGSSPTDIGVAQKDADGLYWCRWIITYPPDWKGWVSGDYALTMPGGKLDDGRDVYLTWSGSDVFHLTDSEMDLLATTDRLKFKSAVAPFAIDLIMDYASSDGTRMVATYPRARCNGENGATIPFKMAPPMVRTYIPKIDDTDRILLRFHLDLSIIK